MLRSLTIKLQLQLHCQNTRVFRRRLSAVELRKESKSNEIKWVGWTVAHNTWEPITNLAGYEGMVAAFEKVWQENYDKKSSEELIRKAVIKLVTATPPAVQPTGSRTPNDTI